MYLLHFLFDFAVIASKFVNQPFWRKNCTICVILMSNREGHEHCTSWVITPPNIWMRGSSLFSSPEEFKVQAIKSAAKPAPRIVDKGPLEISKIFPGRSPTLLEFDYKHELSINYPSISYKNTAKKTTTTKSHLSPKFRPLVPI